MVEADNSGFLAPVLAALSAAAFICAAFYPLIIRSPYSGRRSAVFQALLKDRPDTALPATRTIRRAHEAALKSLVQQGKPSRMSRLERQLAAAGLKIPKHAYVMICFIVGSIIFSIAKFAGLGMSATLIAVILGAWAIPQRYLAFLASRRRLAFLKAFAPAVDMIVRGVKSGLSLMDCLAIVASDAAAPVQQEFESIVAQLKAGVSLPAAMEKLAAIMPAPEVRFFVMIMSAQSQSGGNLTTALGNLSGVLRDREKIAAKTKIASAEGRSSALIIGALPFVVIGATAAFAPHYISFLWSDDAGRRVAFFCLVWLVCGILVLSRMARIEV